ncbi:hypothetical protein LTR53_018152 [Teratosphaeriaceae sp. CCFEE 6253]|nr:hypothetical protein LTR53_018152 [Teratosphaeriaceae sp. CCFEE 6253]
MDHDMQTSAPPPKSRKRSIHHSAADSDDDDDDLAPAEANAAWDTSPKRSRNSQGRAVHRRGPLYYNAQALLSSLSFTRLLVTANFHKYSPHASPILLCIASSPRSTTLYSMLCRVLSRLYTTAPSLQALALLPGINVLESAAAEGGRILPCVATAELREDIAADLDAFRQALGEPAERAVLLDPTGRLVWSSSDDDDDGDGDDEALLPSGHGDEAATAHLEASLTTALASLRPRDHADAMEM